MSNRDQVCNIRDRILRAREAIEDTPLDVIDRKRLDDWLSDIRHLKSKINGQPLAAATVRNIVGAVRMAMTRFVEWQWWTPSPLWEKAFQPYSIKKLQTLNEKKRKKKRPPSHSVAEKRILWHLAHDFSKAMMAMADWAGHTQKEISTLTFDEIKDENGELYIDRDRNKTGVHGRWWIPKEAADVIRRVVSRTPRDPRINPDGLAFLTPRRQPLVHRSNTDRHTRSDYVGPEWNSLLHAATHYRVRHISFKFMRKGTSQFIRDKFDKEVSKTFLAHADEDVQDESYTRACLMKVERAVRTFYIEMKPMFTPIRFEEWEALQREIERQLGAVPNGSIAAAA